MLTEEILAEIKKHVRKEESRCVQYAQWLFDLKYKPKIIIKIPKPSLKVATSKTLSVVTSKETMINPSAIINSLDWRTKLGYHWNLRNSCIFHLSHEIGHEMHSFIIGEDYWRYLNRDYVQKNYEDVIFTVGVFEAVAYYNETSTLLSYKITDPIFKNREIFDRIRVEGLKSAFSMLRQHEEKVIQLSEEDIASKHTDLLSSQCQLLGREYYERNLEDMKPKKFRKWIKTWRPKKETEKERNGYLAYIQSKLTK